ncbi:MAG: hypothetical protein ACQESC_01540 [Nanobdellota archaeon]
MISSVPRKGQEDRAYQTLNVYTSGLSHMHSGPMKPIGSNSNFMHGSQNNIQQDHNLGEMTGNQNLDRYNLTERYDLSGHDNTSPHLNQNINDMNQLNNFGGSKDIITGGSSNKSMDGYKGLGPAHNIDLFNK